MANPLSWDDPKIKAGLEMFLKNQQSKSAAPYYNERSAQEVKRILDELHITMQPLKIRTEGISIATVRLRYYQGLKYLKDNMDSDNRYKELSKCTRCVTYLDYIELHIKKKAQTIISKVSDWKQKFTEWIETEHTIGDKFYPVGVSLSDDEVSWCLDQIEPLKELFLFKITNNEIMIIRYDNKPTT